MLQIFLFIEALFDRETMEKCADTQKTMCPQKIAKHFSPKLGYSKFHRFWESRASLRGNFTLFNKVPKFSTLCVCGPRLLGSSGPKGWVDPSLLKSVTSEIRLETCKTSDHTSAW